MRKKKDIIRKQIVLAGRKVWVSKPARTISEEEFWKGVEPILREMAKRSSKKKK